jgi:hypothetical protein
MSGIAIFVTIIAGLLSRWIIPRGQKSRIILLLAVWIFILGGYKCLKLPNNYEVDRSRHILTKVTGVNKKHETITDQAYPPKVRDIPMRPQNTTFEGEHYLKTEIIRQFNLPLKLRFAAGNLESKSVDTIPVTINCISETAQPKTDVVNVKTDNMLVFYEVLPEFSRVIVEIPSIDSENYPEDDHVNLRFFSALVVNGYATMIVNIGRFAIVVLALYIFVALICIIFDVSPCPFLESINYWQETKNIAQNIRLDVINLCRYFWTKKWLILISSVIGFVCLGIAYFNYSRMPEFPIEHSESNLIWAARMIWSITALIAFLIINNLRKAAKIFWIHFIAWSIIFLLHWLVVNPGYFSTDSYYSIATIVALDKKGLILWGSSMGFYRLLAMVSVAIVPYWGFFIILQALFTAIVIGYIAQKIKNILSNYKDYKTILVLLNAILFFSIPFQCFTLAYVREVPYCLFLLLASISIFLIQLQKNVELKVKNYLIGITAIFLTTQFRVDGLMAVAAFFFLLLIRQLNLPNKFYYCNFLRPLFCFIILAVVATAWCGMPKQNSTTNYRNRILGESLVPLFVNPDCVDSDSDQTKAMILKGLKWDEIIDNFRNDKGIATNNLAWNMIKPSNDIDTRLCFENPFLHFIVRIKCFFQNANTLGVGCGEIHDTRTYTGENFQYYPTTIDYARKTNLIPSQTGYPSNILFKIDLSLRHSTTDTTVIWSFLPEFLILLIVLALYKFFPATASAALLILSVFPPIFFMSPLYYSAYYAFVFYGGLIIIPLMSIEFRYRRYKKKAEEQDQN